MMEDADNVCVCEFLVSFKAERLIQEYAHHEFPEEKPQNIEMS